MARGIQWAQITLFFISALQRFRKTSGFMLPENEGFQIQLDISIQYQRLVLRFILNTSYIEILLTYPVPLCE